jgi:glycogen synthase
MDQIDILRVVPSTYPEVVGGVGLHVHHLSQMQAEMGHDVTVLALLTGT